MRSQRNRTDGRGHRQKGIQAKHLTDEGILNIIRFHRATGDYTNSYKVHEQLSQFVHVPFKVVLAKLGSMDRRGLIECCNCGCGSPMWELVNGKHIV